jgi:hypothetical protein
MKGNATDKRQLKMPKVHREYCVFIVGKLHYGGIRFETKIYFRFSRKNHTKITKIFAKIDAKIFAKTKIEAKIFAKTKISTNT